MKLSVYTAKSGRLLTKSGRLPRNFVFESFSTPCSDITEANCYPFGSITSTASDARVLQGALRLEF